MNTVQCRSRSIHSHAEWMHLSAFLFICQDFSIFSLKVYFAVLAVVENIYCIYLFIYLRKAKDCLLLHHTATAVHYDCRQEPNGNQDFRKLISKYLITNTKSQSAKRNFQRFRLSSLLSKDYLKNFGVFVAPFLIKFQFKIERPSI